MKVLDLQCANKHVFEGWFASEADFQDQQRLGLVECPVCANAAIAKMLSAPRLNFGSGREAIEPSREIASLLLQPIHCKQHRRRWLNAFWPIPMMWAINLPRKPEKYSTKRQKTVTFVA
jgi:hypothetical protein